MYKIKDKQTLKEVLYSEGYDKIIFWKDGDWSLVSSSYSGEQDGDNPIYFIDRVEFSGVSEEEVNEFVDFYLQYNIEESIEDLKNMPSYT